MNVEYSKSIFRDGYAFGRGTRCEVTRLGQEKTREEAIEEATLLGWSHGCPIVRELIGPDSSFSPEWMLQRYASVNKWFTDLCKVAQQTNPSLYRQLRKPTLRFPDEPVGKHEPLSVPFQHLTHIAPMDTPCGYASPRLPIEIIRLGGNIPEKTEIAYAIMVDAVQKAKTRRELLAILSEKVVLAGVDPVYVLEHTLATGILDEENCRREYIKLAEELEVKAPNIMRAYIGLNSADKARKKIAEIPFL